MTTKQISVLLVGDRNTHCEQIETLLNHTRWCVHRARSAGEAKTILDRHTVHVILCQHTLVDGSWRDVWNAAVQCEPPASVVLLAPLDSRTWAELLSLGAYDLLPVPCVGQELYSVIPAAWRHCMHRQNVASAV